MWHVTAGIFAAGALTIASFTPASAQGIFERIFGGLRQTVEAPAALPANIQAFADPFAGLRNAPSPRLETGPASAYCVRTSDGFYFPVRSQAGLSAAKACHAFCLASHTRLYSGGGIDNAVAADGSRYADLDTAFLYRKKLVADATCNGRDRFGLARLDVKTDPTLRPGDIVATRSGLVAFTGVKNKVADFAPLGSDRAVPKSTREKLAGVKIMPTAAGADTPAPIVSRAARALDESRRAQLAR